MRQAGTGPEAGRAEPVGGDRAQLIEPGAVVGAAERFADQPADVVELRIARREQPIGPHRVERVEHAARSAGVEARGLACVLGAGEAVIGGREVELDEGILRLQRVGGLEMDLGVGGVALLEEVVAHLRVAAVVDGAVRFGQAGSRDT